MGSWVERTSSKVVGGGLGQARLQLTDPGRQWIADWSVLHSRADKPGGTIGELDRPVTQGSSSRTQSLKPLIENTCGG